MPKNKGSIGTSTPIKGFAFSWFASCFAETVTCPIDVCKVRLQLAGELGAKVQYRNIFHALRVIPAQEGIGALWKGITPALCRQSIYGTMRYGSYEPIKQAFGVDSSGNCPVWKKIAAAAAAGAGGSTAAVPFDLVKIRLQADQATDAAQKRYRGTFDALRSIARTEGVIGMWRGASPTIARAVVGAMTELPVYDEIKTQLRQRNLMSEGLSLHLASSLSAGLFSCFCMNPFDVAKSRVMNQPVPRPGEAPKYANMIDCMIKSVRAEGITCLWKGFGPAYARVGPRVVIIFVIIEQLREAFD